MAITIIIACHSRNSRHVQNPVKYLLQRILFRSMCNPGIFKILAYSESKKKNHPLQHPAHPTLATHASSLPTLTRHARQTSRTLARTHTTHFATPPTQARHPRQHVIHASTPPTLARHPRKHEQYAISQTPINGILCTITHSYLRRESAWSVAICL